MLEVLDADYVRTARAKGLRERLVVLKHALKNAAMPIVTVIGLQFGLLLGGALVCEMIFAWPGVGRLMIFAIYNRDFPLVEAAVFVMAMVFVLANLLVDLCYAWLDPRVQAAGLRGAAPCRRARRGAGGAISACRSCWPPCPSSPRRSAPSWPRSSPPTTAGEERPLGASPPARVDGARQRARTSSAPISSAETS